jgi:hypothetical protein
LGGFHAIIIILHFVSSISFFCFLFIYHSIHSLVLTQRPLFPLSMSEDANMDVALAPAAASAAATGLASSASVGLPPDIVAMVEGEQALADLQAALKAREKEVEKLKLEKQGFVSDRDAAGTFVLFCTRCFVLHSLGSKLFVRS